MFLLVKVNISLLIEILKQCFCLENLVWIETEMFSLYSLYFKKNVMAKQLFLYDSYLNF